MAQTMNTATLRASARCSRFQEVTPGRTRPFVPLEIVEDLFDALRGDPPTARSLVGRLRDEARGCPVLRRWLLAIADVFEAALDVLRRLAIQRVIERRLRERVANGLLRAQIAAAEGDSS